MVAVVTEFHGEDRAGMPPEDDRAADDHVPDLDRAVHAAGEDTPAIRVECQGIHAMGVAMERGQLAASLRVPEPDALVVAHRRELLSIGAEGEPLDIPAVTMNRPDLGAGGQVPELDRVVLAATDQLPAIGREGHAANPLGVSGQRLADEARLDIPDLDAFEAGQGEAAPIAVEGDGVDPANELAEGPRSPRRR